MGERCTFQGFDHVDLRVPSIERVVAFYNALMPALGLTEVTGEPGDRIFEWAEPQPKTHSRRFFGIHEQPDHVHSDSRIAFALNSRGAVERVAEVAREAGARNFEAPHEAYQYEPYYASFFEDPDGLKLELCFRPGA